MQKRIHTGLTLRIDNSRVKPCAICFQTALNEKKNAAEAGASSSNVGIQRGLNGLLIS